ncbi:MAG TPA: HAMP domain-containing sensor histidine kinase [Acidimicrobiia bacterium]
MTDTTAPTIPTPAAEPAVGAPPAGDPGEVVAAPAAAEAKGSAERRALSISIRIVGLCALLLAAALLVAAGLTYRQTRSQLTRQLDRRLSAAVSSFEEGPAQTVASPEQLGDQARAWLAAQAFPSDQVVAVRTDAGEVITTSGGLRLRDIDRNRQLLTTTTSRWWDLEGEHGRVRAVTVPLVLGGEPAGTIVAAASQADVDDTLSTMLSSVALSSGIALVVVSALAFAAVRRTLRPLARMAGEVQAIEVSGDHSQRVTHDGPADEVGRLADAFNRMLGSLEHTYRSQQQFLSDASHELRTPLTVARGQLELLGDELGDASARHALGTATAEIDRMGRIVEDLLLLARLDEGMTLARRPVEVELVMREALLRGTQGAPREARVDAEPGLTALADQDRLLQVVTNLVTNAVQHADADATLTLSAGRAAERVVLRIADSGPGIPPEDLPHVFERFHRGEAAGTGAPGGTGLGLAIVASLVRAMGGEVSVQSVPRSGTAFTVSLPAAG